MPILDLPLEELKKYEGRNPRPTDFDKFWDDALAEMRSVNPMTELEPAGFRVSSAECYDLYFTGVGGSRIHAKYLRPVNSTKPHPCVILFHGYSSCSGDWSSKLKYISIGYSVAALDCRGQGGLSEDLGSVRGNTYKGHIIRGLDDKPEKLLFRQIFLDTAQLASVVMNMPEVDAERVGLVGGSQGGGLALACAALEPRIKKLAASAPFLCDYKRVWEMDLVIESYQEIGEYFRLFDPLHKREDEIFEKLGYIDVQHLANMIKGEVLMGTGLWDNHCPPSAQFAAYNKITSAKGVLIYPDYGHVLPEDYWDHVFEFMADL